MADISAQIKNEKIIKAKIIRIRNFINYAVFIYQFTSKFSLWAICSSLIIIFLKLSGFHHYIDPVYILFTFILLNKVKSMGICTKLIMAGLLVAGGYYIAEHKQEAKEIAKEVGYKGIKMIAEFTGMEYNQEDKKNKDYKE